MISGRIQHYNYDLSVESQATCRLQGSALGWSKMQDGSPGDSPVESLEERYFRTIHTDPPVTGLAMQDL